MTGRRTRFLDERYQMVERDGSHYLQHRSEDAAWHDIAGPYRQPGSGVERYRRITERQVREARMAMLATGEPCQHPQEWRVTHWGQNRCALCGFEYLGDYLGDYLEQKAEEARDE